MTSPPLSHFATPSFWQQSIGLPVPAIDEAEPLDMGLTDDGLPLVGELPDLPGVFFCVGFNGHGMGLGIAVAERAFGLMMEGKHPGIFDGARAGA